ncbi:MAG: AAA family ATPase [Planctomycetota bacterium]
MIRKVVLENFMSHRHSVFELADGLTVLTGPNNCGKSAVVAALQILAGNGRSTHVLRHGESAARVTVETDDGHVITWQRKKSGAVNYTLDGEDIHRVGGAVPDSVQDVLRLDPACGDSGKSGQEYDVHFGQQKTPIFLIGDSASRAAAFFASSSDASRLIEMQHRHKAHVRDQRSLAKRLRKKIEHFDHEIEQFKTVPGLQQRIHEAQSKHSTLGKLSQRCGDLRQRIARLIAASHHVTQLRATESCLLKLTDPPSQSSTQPLRRLSESLGRVHRDSERLRRDHRILLDLEHPPTLHPSDRLRIQVGRLLQVTQRVQTCQRDVSALSKLDPPPVIQPTEDIRSLVRSLITANQVVGQFRGQVDAYQRLSEPPHQRSDERLRELLTDLQRARLAHHECSAKRTVLARLSEPALPLDLTLVAGYLSRLTRYQDATKSARAAYQNAEKATRESEQRVHGYLEDHPTCQTCGGTIDPVDLLAAARGVPGHQHDQSSARTTSRVGAAR